MCERLGQNKVRVGRMRPLDQEIFVLRWGGDLLRKLEALTDRQTQSHINKHTRTYVIGVMNHLMDNNSKNSGFEKNAFDPCVHCTLLYE